MDEIDTAPAPKPSYDPLAPPDARWRTAEEIVEGTEQANEYTDSHVLAAVCHLSARAKPNTPGFHASIAGALGIYRDDILLRTEVEARILVGQSDLEIAKAVGMSEDVMLYYRSLFFDMWPGATDYLAIHVTGFRGFHEFRNHEIREFVLFQVAQGGGPLILEMWLKSMRAAHRTGEKPQLSDYLQPDRKLDPSIQRLVAIACLPPDKLWSEWWNQIQTRWNEVERETNPPLRAIQAIELQHDVIQAARAVLAGATSPPVDAGQARQGPRKRRSPLGPDSKKDRPQGVQELQAQLQELIRSL
ncbi:MAG: hypothetical protein JWN70_6152 [Planctomycetaceae bacterium]|nr:hypothetical protein [Planctomycetaceae bacterium]